MPSLLNEIQEAVYRARANTHRRYAHTPSPRITPPCPHCNDAALINSAFKLVQVDLPSDIFLLVDHEIADTMRRYGWFDGTFLPVGTSSWRFMGVPVILAPYTEGYKVCRGA